MMEDYGPKVCLYIYTIIASTSKNDIIAACYGLIFECILIYQ